MSSPTFPYFCLLLAVALLLGFASCKDRPLGRCGGVFLPPPHSKDCNASTCLVYVSKDASKCPPGFRCYSSLNDASEKVFNNQRIELLDEKTVLDGLVFLCDLWNITIISVNGTEISMDPNSPDINGPYIVLQQCQDFRLVGLTLNRVVVGGSVISTVSTSAVFENFVCNASTMTHKLAFATKFPGPCIGGRGSQLRIVSSQFTNCQTFAGTAGTVAVGGAIALDGGRLYVVDSYFGRNQLSAGAAYGGAIYLKDGYLSLFNTSFVDNRVTGVTGHGGAVYLFGGDLEVTLCEFTRNSISVVVPSEALGGAIYQLSQPIMPTTISYSASIISSNFTNNTIVGSGNFEGGAISVGARSVILQNNFFYRNRIHSPRILTQVSTSSTFSVKGGAVRLMAHDMVILNNRFIQNNVSAPRGYTPGWSYGGAIDVATDTFSRTFSESIIVVKDNIFQYNHAIGGSSTEDNSGGGAFGGAIRIVALDAKITLEHNRFLRNTAVGGDGPISGGIAQGAAIVINHLSYLNYSMLEAKLDLEYTLNLQRYQTHRSVQFPLFSGDSSMDRTFNEQLRTSNISRSTALEDAPEEAIFNPDGIQRAAYFKKPVEVSEVYISHCGFNQNGLKGGMGAMMGGDAAGGALYFEGSMLDLKDCQFHINGAQGGDTSNSAIGANSGGFGKGGAIFLHQSTTSVSIADSVFKTNFAYGGRGWNDRVYPIPFKFGRSGISFGGAIAAWSYFGDTNVNPVNIYRSTFMSNRANCQALPASCGPGIGGAIWGRLLFVYDSLFMRNDAAHGGAIYALSLSCDQCLFHNNQVLYESETSGGAVYANNATITNSHFESNSATSSKLGGSAVGGAVHSDESLDLRNSTFFTNHVLAQTIGSVSQGGAVAASKRLIIQNCRFNHNGALTETGDGMVGQGGSLYLDISAGPSELTHLSIKNSVASYGGGIYIRGAAAVDLVWSGVKVRFNNATRAGGGIAYLPDNYDGDIVTSYVCSTCEVNSNLAAYYGNDVISPYAAIVGSTSAVTKPGLPFSAKFNILDFSLNIVKEYDLRLSLIPNSTRPFQSGVWQNEEVMDFKTGFISFPSMTAWGVPGEVFALNFSLTALNMGDFGAPDEISLSVPYQLSSCPPGHKLDTSSTYTSCQQCSVGEYGFRSNCTTCPDDYVCASTPFNPLKPTPLIYQIEAGFVPSPRINPTAIIECPYSTAERVNGLLQSSCLPSTCATDCGPNRDLTSSLSHSLTTNPVIQDPTLLPACQVLCDENSCATGYTGFLCSQCVCKDQGECWYPADETCHRCKSTWRPTVVIFAVAAGFFILLKGTLLVLVMGVLSIVVISLLTFDLVSTLIPSIFGTAFIIFAEAQRGSSSGLIKSFVFYIQTISVFITPEVMPRQLSRITSVRVLTQFRVFGLECLSKEMFGDPFQRFLFSMVLPLALLFIVSVLYWLCEFLRGISIFRALQDFDPLDHIPFFRSRLSRARGYHGGEFSLLKDELQSESEVSLVGEAYLSDTGTNDMSAWIAAETDYLESQETLSWKDHVQFMNRKIGRVALFLAFASHFELCNRVLEVFAPCVHVPSENFSYSSTYPWLICSNRAAGISFFSPHTVHGRMAISGLIFGFFYIIGIPVVFISLLYWKRTEIKAGDSSTGRWLGLLYNSYRPSLHYFELAWLFRRILFAASISIIPYPLVSHFLAPCCVLFISLLIQRRYKPFISKSDNNMEMISLLSNLFAIIANAVITSRPTAIDATVWRWLNFFIFTITLLAFLYKLFKPFLLFLRPVSKED